MAAQREWLEKDYYKVLGVSDTATPKEITSAYRKLARQLHPDANPGDPTAEERFKSVSEAYAVLSDPEQRKEYDQVRRLAGRAGTATLAVDGADVARTDLTLLMRVISSVGPSVGFDHGSAVSDRYAAPFGFTGDLHEVVIQASPERHADTAAAEDRAGMHRQ